MSLPRQADEIPCRERLKLPVHDGASREGNSFILCPLTPPTRRGQGHAPAKPFPTVLNCNKTHPRARHGMDEKSPVKHAGLLVPSFANSLPYARICLLEVIFCIKSEFPITLTSPAGEKGKGDGRNVRKNGHC